MRYRTFLFALVCQLASVLTVLADSTRPNNLLIVSDDQGYVDAGFQGGTDVPTPHKYDSVDLSPHLTGQLKSATHSTLYWRAALGKAFAVREGSWKLVRLSNAPDALCDLESDISESNDLATTHPEIAVRLASELEGFTKEVIDPVFLGSTVKSEDCRAIVLNCSHLLTA